jgi:hypothetical protein
MAPSSGIDCNIHLVALNEDLPSQRFLELLVAGGGSKKCIIEGRLHGWVHPPLANYTKQLRGHDWDLFLLTNQDVTRFPEQVVASIKAHVMIRVTIPNSEYEDLKNSISTTPSPNVETPPLPKGWGQDGGIPESTITTAERSGNAGELKLDSSMADFLSSTLPSTVRDKPVSLFNLFKYPKGDQSVHDAYMDGFKEKFGGAAGAIVKFMGPVRGGLEYSAQSSTDLQEVDKGLWKHANLVQYDSIWHYAYMLSTDI